MRQNRSAKNIKRLTESILNGVPVREAIMETSGKEGYVQGTLEDFKKYCLEELTKALDLLRESDIRGDSAKPSFRDTHIVNNTRIYEWLPRIEVFPDGKQISVGVIVDADFNAYHEFNYTPEYDDDFRESAGPNVAAAMAKEMFDFLLNKGFNPMTYDSGEGEMPYVGLRIFEFASEEESEEAVDWFDNNMRGSIFP